LSALTLRMTKTTLPFPAEVVELVDALASGASERKLVGVRVPPSALLTSATGQVALPPARAEGGMCSGRAAVPKIARSDSLASFSYADRMSPARRTLASISRNEPPENAR